MFHSKSKAALSADRVSFFIPHAPFGSNNIIAARNQRLPSSIAFVGKLGKSRVGHR
jgi:hypothetical protein